MSETRHHQKQSVINGLVKDLSDRDKALRESAAAIVEKDRLIAQLREATTTQESELARLRSEALVSQQTIDTLHPQMSTTTANHGAPTQEQQRGMQPPAHLPNYSWALLFMGGPTLRSVVMMRDPPTILM
jgi:hypothetical protein